MTIYLKQSTASQEVVLGRFVDSTDGNTEETALTIANTDIKLWVAGATTLANKNSGGATHIANGLYYCVLDATDTATLGSLVIHVHVSGALSVKQDCVVLAANVYDSLIGGGDVLDVSTTQFNGTALTQSGGRPEVNVTHAAGTAWNSGGITASTLATDSITSTALATSAITEIQTGLSTLDAAGVRSAVGLASANLDTQLTTIDDFLDTEIAAIKTKTDFLPSATAGASGGLLIAGSNAATTFASVTSTGALTVSDGIIVTASTTNRSAISATGNGTGHGITATSGSGATGNGINAASAATAGHGLNLQGNGTSGHGLLSTGGSGGRGINAVGGNNSVGFGATGSGTGPGMLIAAGPTGIGIDVRGGTTSGNAINVTTTSGHGLNIAPTGTNMHGIQVAGGNGGTSDGIKVTAGTGGVAIRGDITGNITGNLSGTTGDSSNITAIKAKTDNLPSDPADASDIATAFSGVNTKLDAIDDFVDTEVAAIKTVTDKLDSAMELDGSVYRFTINALEQAPAGGGGGSTDWTADERTAIRSILGIPGTGTTPTDPTTGILDTIRDKVDVVDAIVDKVDSAMELDGSVYRFTTNALEQAPTGGGSLTASDVWSHATRTLTSGANIALAKGTGVTGFNDLDAAGIRSAVGLASANLDTQLTAIDDFLDTEVSAIKAKTDQLTFTVANTVDANMRAIGDTTSSADRLERSTLGIVTGTVGSGSTTTSIVTSALSPSAVAADQFKGKIVTFTSDTTTTALRGQSTDITANTSGGVLTVTALTNAPVSGDTFVIT